MPADAGVDAPVDAPAADAPPVASPPVEEPDTDADKKDKKHKHKHEDAEPTGETPSEEHDVANGDLVESDDIGGVSEGPVNLRFLLQPRYVQTFVHSGLDTATVLDPRLDDGWAINRAFLRVTASPKPWLEAKVLADFAELQHRNPKRALKLAYAELKPDKRVSIYVGLFKRTFSLLELLPIADFELANSGPTDTLIKDAELGGRDTGAMVHWAPLQKKKWLGLYLAAYSGNVTGANARPWGLVTGRITSEPIKHLTLAIDGAYRQYPEVTTPGVPASPGKGRAISADATWHRKRYEIRGEWLWGTRSDEDNAGLAKTWMAAWGIAAVRFPVDEVVLMPAARFEWLDADLEHDIGRRYYISGGLNVMNRTDSVRVLLDVTRSQVQRGSFPLSVAPVLLDASSTIIVAQAQIKI